MSVLPMDGTGMRSVVIYQFTGEQLEDLALKIARGVMEEMKPKSMKLTEAARHLGVSRDSLERRVKAKLVAQLPNIGPIRIPMREINRLNAEGLPPMRD